MIKEHSLGEPTIYIGDKKIEGVTKLSCPDLGIEEDKTGVTVWDKGTINYEISFSISDENNPIGKWFQRMIRQFRRNRKALKWALTHGYVVRIDVETEKGEQGYYKLTKPSELNNIMRYTKFIPRYRIYDINGDPYVIRKGKVVRFRFWPFTQEMIELYEKKLKRYNI